jgi:hypothetical protein
MPYPSAIDDLFQTSEVHRVKPPGHSGGRHPYRNVNLIRAPGSPRIVLGESEPLDDDRRARAATQWGTPMPAPRKQPLATIDTPLPARAQTILSYGLDPATRRLLDGGASPSPVSRREAERAVVATDVLDRED